MDTAHGKGGVVCIGDAMTLLPTVMCSLGGSLQCDCKAQVNLHNIRDVTTATIDGAEVTIQPGIYVASVSSNAHCCPFGPLGGSLGRARGPDGLPVHK